MKVMAIDYGDQRTGVAVSDALGIIAGEAWTITEWNAEALCEKILNAARERGVGTIVLGYPLNMDGTAGARAEKSLELKSLLEENSDYKVVMWDERRTTVDAQRILRENGKNSKKGRGVIDAVAATLILEGYINMIK